jgi:hypothetical protein
MDINIPEINNNHLLPTSEYLLQKYTENIKKDNDKEDASAYGPSIAGTLMNMP